MTLEPANVESAAAGQSELGRKGKPPWAAIALGVGLVLGLIGGVWLGRSTAPSFDEQVGDLRSTVSKVDADLSKLPATYRGDRSGDKAAAVAAKISSSVAKAETALEPVLADASWLTAEQRRQVAEALDAIRDGARRGVAVGTFNARVSEARTLLQTFFGLPASKA